METRLVSYSQPAPGLDPADFLRQAQGHGALLLAA